MAGINVTCPSCKFQFEPGEVFLKEYEQQARQKLNVEWQKMKAEVDNDKKALQQEKELVEKIRKEQEQEIEKKTQERLTVEKTRIQEQLEINLRKTISADFENKLSFLESANKENEEKLKAARQKELDFLKKEQELLNKEAELEIQIQKQLQEERELISEQIRRQESEKNLLRENEYQLKLKEMEKQLDDQKKLAEEMKRKAEQVSMQLQGEVQELALEEMLKSTFPFDLISEVGKGVRGADCVQIVRNSSGQECGKIIYESKRSKTFVQDWIEKLKADARSLGAEVAVIVTQSMPKDMDCFGEKNGVWICSFGEVKALACVLRDLIIKVHTAAKSEVNKGEKMQMLYSYLTSHEFADQWKAIREGFLSMKLSIQKERDSMEKLWKAREKQLEKVLLNAAHIRGSIEGIAGLDSVDLHLVEDDAPEEKLLE